jgi:hypothetical protein
LQSSGQFHDAAVDLNNVRIERLPDRVLASLAGLVRKPQFESTETGRADGDIGTRSSA